MDEQTEVKYGIDKKRLRLIIIVAAAVLFFVGQSVYLRTRDNTQPTQNVNDVSYQNAYEYLLECAKNMQVLDVTNGSETDKIGQRGVIYAQKSEVAKMTGEEFKKFGEYVETFSYNWLTIAFEDGTGVVFQGCNGDLPGYGKLDEYGRTENETIIKTADNKPLSEYLK